MATTSVDMASDTNNTTPHIKETNTTMSLQDEVQVIAEDAFVLGAKSFQLNTIKLIESSLDNPALENLPSVVTLQVLAKMLMAIDIDELRDNMNNVTEEV